MNPVSLFVDAHTFDPNRISMSSVQTVLRLGLKCAICDYLTHETIGWFVPTTCNPWGFTWIKRQTPISLSYREVTL